MIIGGAIDALSSRIVKQFTLCRQLREASVMRHWQPPEY